MEVRLSRDIHSVWRACLRSAEFYSINISRNYRKPRATFPERGHFRPQQT